MPPESASAFKTSSELKSFRRKDGREGGRWPASASEPRSGAERGAQLPWRETFERDASEYDGPGGRLYRKVDGQPARPCYIDHVLMENRHGLVIDGGASLATGTAERDAALELLDRRPASGRITPKRITLGAGKAYEVTQFVHDLRRRKVTPHIAINGHTTKTGKQRKTAIDGRTTRHAGYEVSRRCRRRIEEVFGWLKGSAGLDKVKVRGRDRVDAAFILALAAYNLVRLPKLLAASA